MRDGGSPVLRFSWVATLAARTADGREAVVVARSPETFENPAEAVSDAASRTWSVARGVIRCDGSEVTADVTRPAGVDVPDLTEAGPVEVVATDLEATVCDI